MLISNNKYSQLLTSFCKLNDLIINSIESLQQDASFRQYYRIITNKGSYLIMDCSNEQVSFLPFLQIQELLQSNDILVPQILLVDSKNFFAIIEDLGNNRMKDLLLTKKIDQHYDYYSPILNIMNKIQNVKVDNKFTKYSEDKLLLGIKTFINWYLSYINISINSFEEEQFIELWKESFTNLSKIDLVLNLMDFHVENLMVYHNKIYVIDFQDAYLTWPAYDLVSLLQDARYELPEAIANKLFYDYCKIIKINPIIMFSDYNIIGAQRNCRILGVFARKYIKDKNSNYLKLIPLVLKYLKENLNAIESLKPIKSWMITKGVL